MGRRKKCEQIKRTNNVMVRFTDAEYASISISAEQAGYPVAVYVRKSALDERIEVHYNITAELPELQKLIAEYSAIGNNLNQIAQYFHSGGFYSKSIQHPLVIGPVLDTVQMEQTIEHLCTAAVLFCDLCRCHQRIGRL